ncbi:S8 family serine peptidase [Tenacibaculum sp. KUL113]|uniref:S8 family serine peptidase n=1 Tax=Alteromonas sp. OM2203 TaxID=3398817 RepID=UPI0012E6C9F5|nr:hypothetical protein KUL113_32370 [Tenacibaculum sp. KUL113]
MKNKLINTVVATALAGSTFGALAVTDTLPIKGTSTEQKNAIEGSFDKKSILINAIQAGNDRVRVIVQLNNSPMAQFSGVNTSLSSASAHKGQKVNFKTNAAKEYKSFLQEQQQSVIQRIKTFDSSFNSDFSYTTAFNGFAGTVSKGSLEKLASLPNVKAVYPDVIHHAQMDASLDLIGAIETWEQLGGKENAGAGVKVAIIDSGIRPENALFSGTDFTAPDPATLPTDDYCSEVPGFCNNKLIVARAAPVTENFDLADGEYESPLGFNGHGTHVAGTAVGNYGVLAKRGGAEAEISGVAPAAYLMVYKGLYATSAEPTRSSGASSMLLSMLEASLEDGADIVNNSWGGGAGGEPSSFYAGVFEAMEDAGVVTVFAAGNDGPGDTTIGCPGCDENVLTVANTTTGRLFANEVTIAGDTSIGAIPAIYSVGNPDIAFDNPLTAPVIFAGEIDADNIEGCAPYASEDAFDNAIALIIRGTCSFADKIANAEAAGATAVLVYNQEGRGEAPIQMAGLRPEQMVPSLMLPSTPGAALADLTLTSEEAITITIGNEIVRVVSDSLADIMNENSSRGPGGDPTFLKPNIAAPGTRIFSGESPDAPDHLGESFSFKDGTSMAAPHVAGAAALLKQMHPDWSAQQIKSALVTSSIRDIVKEDAATPADNFDIGAGRLDLQRATSVELTYSDLSLVSADCLLTCEMSITVTNTSDSDVAVDATAMFDDSAITANITPSMATLPAGASAEVLISFDASSADTNVWAFGGINWSDNNDATTDYFIPVAIYPITSDEPDLFSSSVSTSVAEEGELVVTEATINNTNVTGLISVSSVIDSKYNIEPKTISAVINGNQESVKYSAETREITWEGAVNTASLSMTESTSIGDLLSGLGAPRYLPMSAINISPLVCSDLCDDASITVDIPRPITYLGNQYTSMQISSNGYVSLGTSSGKTTSPFAEAFPNLLEPNNVIAPFWTDFDLAGGDGTGNMYAVSLTTGHFVVEWENAQLFDQPGTSFNFQLWFEYASGTVHFVYGPMDAPVAPTVVGAEDSTGKLGTTLAALTSNSAQGTIPASSEEYTLSQRTGDQVSITYAGSILAASELMDDSLQVNEDASITANILANEMDDSIINSFTMSSLSGSFRTFAPINIDKAELDPSTVEVVSDPGNGSVIVNDNGTVTYSPNPDFFGQDTFTYTVRELGTINEEGDVVMGDVIGEGTVSVSVSGVQDAPIISISAPSSVDEGEAYTVSASATDADGDEVAITINGAQTATLSGLAPSHEQSSRITVTVTATDGIDTTTETVTIPVNDKRGGSISWLALLLAPAVYLRRRFKL